MDANLPANYVSKVLGLSRNTIHRWFRGKPMHEGKRKVVEAFISLVKDDMANGILPARNIKSAKAYLQAMVNDSVSI